MDKFLDAALAPKAKRKVPMGRSDRDGQTLNSTSTAAKRPRRQNLQSADGAAPAPALAELEATKPKTTAAVASSSEPSLPALPSFRAVMAGQGTPAGPTRTRILYEKAEALAKEERLEDALKILTRALVSCACQASVRRQFKQAGVPLESIDPIGQCSCRDFVAAAQTRRPRHGALGSALPEHGRFPISELDLAAVYGLATDGASCMCGSGRVRCALPDHLDTLDRLAAAAIKLGQSDLALQASQWHIDLAPHQAQGYLHLAKTVLLKEAQASESSSSESCRTRTGPAKSRLRQTDARFTALCIYNHGRHAVREHGDPESPLLDVLARCCRQYSRGDFLPNLPLETAEAILQQLSLSDLLACLRVSKRWAAALRRARLCLSTVKLPGAVFEQKKPQRRPPLKGLHKLLRRMPGLQTRRLHIHFHSNPGTQYAPFVEGALRHFLRHAESVELETWWSDPDSSVLSDFYSREPAWPRLAASPATAIPSRCRKLVLNRTTAGNRADIAGIITWASESLEHLELMGPVDDYVDFPLPKLRILRAVSGTWSNRTERGPSYRSGGTLLLSICAAAPQLEQLYLDEISFGNYGMASASAPARETLHGFDIDAVDSALRSLRALYIGTRCHIARPHPLSLAAYVRPCLFPKLPAGMRCIDITCADPAVTELVLFGSGRPQQDAHEPFLPPFAQLEAFRCLAPVSSPQRLFGLIQPSLNGPDGRLAHLEVDASRLDSDAVAGVEPYHFVYPERLRTVGLHNFDWDQGSLSVLVGGAVRGSQFVDWAQQFRNAESISMYPAWQGTASWANHSAIKDGELLMLLVERIAKIARATNGDNGESWSRMRLRTVYQGLMRGSMIGVMEQWQEQTFGKQVIEFPRGHAEFRQPVFPWPDGDLEEGKPE